ncbi:MAG: cytochrome c biogenesis protein ResB, partial [Gammaproteobacteria bacterium]|nr:cytochrome c biogenesis protein ResB [Gammaproteobacteria bacterium]
ADTPSRHPARSPTRAGVLLEFLGSMNLAIMLLVAVAVASIIGTVLKQNEAYQNYIVKFGPFWFEAFKSLGLYDVYSAGWFLLILAFLVLSTSVCIYRNVPHMLRDMRSFRLNVQESSLRAFHVRREWTLPLPAAEVEQRVSAFARAKGYRVRSKDHGDHRVVAAMSGAANRLGYLFTHAAIVVICIGGLLDGNLPLKLKEMSGQIKIETRDIPAAEVPRESWLSVKNPSFRGSITVPEGSTANIAFLQLRDGYLVQPLPFKIELKDFRIEHYETGQPKSFESDLVITANGEPNGEPPLAATIAVNHPLLYKGYAIYQSSFNDGGTRMQLKAWSLGRDKIETQAVKSAVFERLKVDTAQGPMTLELDDFRLFNINPAEEGAKKRFRNYGPNFTFKVRNAEGEAREYENYMAPIDFEGRLFFLSGMRTQVSDPFFYLHLPADPKGTLERFMHFNALLRNAPRVAELSLETTRRTFSDVKGDTKLENPNLIQEVSTTMQRLVDLFARGGFEAIDAQVKESVPEAQRAQVLDAYLKVLRNILNTLYLDVLNAEGVDTRAGISAREGQFYDDAINALAVLPQYGSPFFLELNSFEHVQASGLQIARAPGKNVVYLGFALLIAGVFTTFYINHRRLWFWLREGAAGTEVLFAGAGNRDVRDFRIEFDRLAQALDGQLSKTK